MQFFVTVLILATIMVQATTTTTQVTSTCPPGQYFYVPSKMTQGQCVQCSRGWFCPGDDHIYQCAGNTIAPDFGMTKCTPCPSDFPTACAVKTFCMPPDVPPNAKYMPLKSLGTSEPIYLDSNDHHIVTEIAFLDKDQVAVLNFFNRTRNALPWGAYLSTKSGNPSESNYEMKAYGQNLTFAFQRSSFQSDYIPVYLSLEYPSTVFTSNAVVIGSYYGRVVLEDGQCHVIDIANKEYMVENPYVFFTAPSVKSGQKLNITVSIEEMNKSKPSLMYSTIFSHTDRSVQFPTEYNYDIVASSVVTSGTFVQTSLIVQSSEDGPFYFSVDLREYNEANWRLSTTLKIQ